MGDLDAAAEESPAALPGGAEPVEGVEGYSFVVNDSGLVLYGPDHTVAASAQGYPRWATIGDVTFPVSRISPSRATATRSCRLSHRFGA